MFKIGRFQYNKTRSSCCPGRVLPERAGALLTRAQGLTRGDFWPCQAGLCPGRCRALAAGQLGSPAPFTLGEAAFDASAQAARSVFRKGLFADSAAGWGPRCGAGGLAGRGLPVVLAGEGLRSLGTGGHGCSLQAAGLCSAGTGGVW